MLFLLFIILVVVSESFLYDTFDISIVPDRIGISDECTLYSNENITVVKFHGQRRSVSYSTTLTSDIYSINGHCDMVLFGYPDQNSVVVWKPLEGTELNITKEDAITPNSDIFVDRFGFSLDIKGYTWIVGAPGTPNTKENQYSGSTVGYAFVFNDTTLHACRSPYDSYAVPLDDDALGLEGQSGVNNAMNYYKKLKSDDRYEHVFSNTDTDQKIKETELYEFQKVCMAEQPIYYATGQLNPKLMDYIVFQQFGYSVAITGEIGRLGSTLFISAPGDTNRFMEDNDGKNYGRVYMWDSWIRVPDNRTLANFTWWGPSVYMPLIAPNLPGATYRAFGRSIAASRSNLAVSSYPLYDDTREPFILIYDCDSALNTFSNCRESENRGISINNLPGNVLGYMSREMLGYTDGKAGLPYIPARDPTGILGDFQNDFIGKYIGVTGSNIIIPNKRKNVIYRFGNDSRWRETHSYQGAVHFGSNTQHWVLQTHKKLTHFWNCPLGTVGPKKKCNFNDESCINSACSPCQTQYYSTDGYLDDCETCRVNFTTYQEGMYYCDPWYPPLPDGLLWTDAFFTMYVILGVVCLAYGVFLCWEYSCTQGRRTRTLYSIKV